jgi:phosphoribosylformylglycinamidine synthase
MIELLGAPAFTPARLEKRLAAVRRGNPGITALSAHFVHLIDESAPLDAAARATLDRLLRYGPRASSDPQSPL